MSAYDFRDILPTDSDNSNTVEAIEGFQFGNYVSSEHDLFLIERNAPTPTEKEIVETVPYMQGQYDFSMIGTDRFFSNRTVTFKVAIFSIEYTERKQVENLMKMSLMPLGIQNLYDTHNIGYHWQGKCKSITVDDDAEKRMLTATIEFDCYPYAISDTAEGSDVWDSVYFPNWIFQNVKYTVNGATKINLYNVGAHTTNMILVVDGNFTLHDDTGAYELTTGTYTNSEVSLSPGVNTLSLVGIGTIEFKFYQEVML